MQNHFQPVDLFIIHSQFQSIKTNSPHAYATSQKRTILTWADTIRLSDRGLRIESQINIIGDVAKANKIMPIKNVNTKSKKEKMNGNAGNETINRKFASEYKRACAERAHPTANTIM
jgi:hypothetical protein